MTYTSNQHKRILILLLTELFELLNIFLISFFFICSHFIVYETSNEISSWLSFYHWFDKATKNLKSMTPEEWGLGTGWVDLVLPFHTGITLIFFIIIKVITSNREKDNKVTMRLYHLHWTLTMSLSTKTRKTLPSDSYL